jgi:hypothetical protein
VSFWSEGFAPLATAVNDIDVGDVERAGLVDALSLKATTLPAQYSAVPMTYEQDAAPVLLATLYSMVIVLLNDSVDSRSLVQPAVTLDSLCALPLYARLAIHNSSACVVVAVVPDTMVVAVTGVPTVSPFADLSTGFAGHPCVAFHSLRQMYMVCVVDTRFHVHEV